MHSEDSEVVKLTHDTTGLCKKRAEVSDAILLYEWITK